MAAYNPSEGYGDTTPAPVTYRKPAKKTTRAPRKAKRG